MTGGRKWEARERGDGTWIVRNTQNCQLVAEDLTETAARDIAGIDDIKAERDAFNREKTRHADRIEGVAAVLSVERVQGWANPLVCDLVDAVKFLRGTPDSVDTGEAVLTSIKEQGDG